MTKRLRSITNKLAPAVLIAAVLILWQVLSDSGVVQKFMLPSPTDVGAAFVRDFPNLMSHTGTTLAEAFLGLFVGIALAFVTAFLMDRFSFLYRALYPLLVVSQTIPPVAIAPLLVLWLGYGITPKVTLVVIVCFFPITVGLLDGFKSADPDMLNLMRAMGANRSQIFRIIKLPSSLGHFFAGLKISVSYSVVGAVISEWLGGDNGLGVYMTRVNKSFAFDKMFAVILLVSVVSLLLMRLVTVLERVCVRGAAQNGSPKPN